MTGRHPPPLLLSPRWRVHGQAALRALVFVLVAVPATVAVLAVAMGAGAAAPLAIAGALVGTAVAGAFAVAGMALWRGRGGTVDEIGRAARAMEKTGALMQDRLDEIERAAARLDRSVTAARDRLEEARARRRPGNEEQDRRAGEPCGPLMPDHARDHAGVTGVAWPSPGSRAGSPATLRRAAARERPGGAAFAREIERYLTVSRKV